MKDYYMKVVQTPLSVMQISGLNPTKPSLPVCLLNIAMYLIMATFVAMDLVFKVHDFDNVINFCTSSFLISHVTLVTTTMIRKRPLLLEILSNMDAYAPIDASFGEDFEAECLKMLTTSTTILKAFLGYCFTCFATVYPLNYYLDQVPVKAYRPEGLPYWAFLMHNVTYVSLGSIVSVALATFFCAIVSVILVQFRILNKSLSSLDFEDLEEDAFRQVFRGYVWRHNFILQQVGLLNQAFGPMLLLFLGIQCIVVCLLLLVFTETKGEVDTANAMLLFGCWFELFFCYFLPTQILTNESDKLCTSIYMSNWYQCPHNSVKKSLLIMMVYSQREITVQAGNLFPMNFQTFTSISRSMFSYRTFLVRFK